MYGKLVVNSTVCYLLAFLLTTVLHECGHAVVGSLLGSGPVLHHNYVVHMARGSLSIPHQAWIALAGPSVSLLQALALFPLVHHRKGGGLFDLFLLWMVLLGFGNFLGYLMTGPLFTAGDVGKVHRLLEVPMVIRIALAFLGGALLCRLAIWSTRPFLRFTREGAMLESQASRSSFNLRIIIFPWLIGSAVMTLLYLPVIAVVSIIYPISSGMVFIFPWKNARRITDARPYGSRRSYASAWPWYGMLLIAVLVFRLVLEPGVAF